SPIIINTSNRNPMLRIPTIRNPRIRNPRIRNPVTLSLLRGKALSGRYHSGFGIGFLTCSLRGRNESGPSIES
ncbi:MAG: hypothetical protein LAT68_16135, partial [Cyclobacteriaceae bacterium]|nr:hypothetical protein [Cyclobacteriaceae bacterium]